MSDLAAHARPVVAAAASGRRGRVACRLRVLALPLTLVAGTFVAAVLFVQFGLEHLGVKSFVVPKPTRTIAALQQNWSDILAPALWFTVREVLAGLALGVVMGVVLAVVLNAVPVLQTVVLPYVVALMVTPMIALVPIVFLEFGDALWVRIMIVAVAASPMVMLNTLTGLGRTPQIRLDLMCALRATRRQRLWKVELPSALPTMCTGLQIGAIFAIIAAVGTEFVSSDEGLGAVIVYHSSLAQTDVVFAAILLLVVLGLALFGTIVAAQHRFTGWKE